jgi:hypothetical protein
MQKLCGRGSGGNLSRGRGSNKANVSRLRPGTFGNKSACTYARNRRCYDQMAQHTGVSRSIGMVMPHGSERRPEQ